MENFEKKFNSCKAIKEKDERINCMFDVLNRITQKQDVMNISMMKTLNDDSDPRWKPIHMIDDANAIILGISRNKGNPKTMLNEGYVDEKVSSLRDKWFSIRMTTKRD